MRKLIFVFLVMLCGAPLSAQTPFALDRVAEPIAENSDSRAFTGWAVPYKIEGVLAVTGDYVTLNTADGRIFRLAISARKAKKFNGQTVAVSAMARSADDLALLKVSKIALTQPAKDSIVLPFLPRIRPAVAVTSSSDSVTIGNVRWCAAGAGTGACEDDWRDTVLRPEMIDSVYFVKKPFPPEMLAAHSLMLVTFKPGGMTDSLGEPSRGLVLTIEAYLQVGQKYSIAKGLGNNFKIVWGLMSWDSYVRESCFVNSKKLVVYPVKLDLAQKKYLLNKILAQALVNRSGEYYNTVTNNCTNNLVMLLNNAVGPSKAIPMWRLPSLVYNYHATMPVIVPHYLKKHGLLGDEIVTIDSANAHKFIKEF